jgi:hypothetical protein
MQRSACFVSALVLGAGLFLFAPDAHAQAPADGVAPAPGAGGGGAPPPPRHEDEDADGGRLRIGFSINPGYGTGGNLSGPAFGGTFRIGYQINHLLGIYGNISPFVWLGTSSLTVGGKTPDVGAIAGVQTAPMISVTPIDLLEIAAGPSADYLTGGSTSVGTVTASAFSSVYLGIHGRLALHFGSRNPDTGRRKGFALGVDAHPTFTPGSAVTFFTLTLGADWY